MSVEITEFKPVVKNTLRGFLTAQFASGMIINEISLHVRDGRAWVSPPSRTMIGKDGAVMRDEEGKPRYSPMVQFASRESRDRWSAAILAALRVTHPQALADEGGAR